MSAHGGYVMAKNTFRQLSALCVVLFCLAGQRHASAANMAGEGDSVKSLPSRDFDAAKKTGSPMCIYFYDQNAQKTNNMVKLIEASILANAELHDKLKPFLMLKIRTDGTDVKGWPQDWRDTADKGASLLFTTSDLKPLFFYDKSKGKEATTLENIEFTIQQILSYEDKKKGIRPGTKEPKEAKEKPEPVAEVAKPLPGLNMDKDPKEPAKKPEPKKKKSEDRDE